MIMSENVQVPMHLNLRILKQCNFFWLRDIRDVDITKCCAKCFIGGKDNRVYYGTLYTSQAVVDIDVQQHPKAKAYYLCGLSAGFVWALNTHVAFVPEIGSEVVVDNDRISLRITNARRILFEDYVPHPEGNFSENQRNCRNWIFANYIKDGMPL